MDYGLSISASGALTAMYRMDVLANNLANMSTAGFKPDVPVAKQRAVAPMEGEQTPSNQLLERLGGGVHQGVTRVNFEQGALNDSTGNLDLGIQGEGFFVLRERSEGNSDGLRLTRNGRFTLDSQSRIVHADSGMPVLSNVNDAITVNPNLPVRINGDGSVSQNGTQIARIKLAQVADTSRLAKAGQSMFVAPAEVLSSKLEASGIIRQGALEQSTVDPLSATMQITSAAREFESNITMMQMGNKMLDRAVNGLGRMS